MLQEADALEQFGLISSQLGIGRLGSHVGPADSTSQSRPGDLALIGSVELLDGALGRIEEPRE